MRRLVQRHKKTALDAPPILPAAKAGAPDHSQRSTPLSARARLARKRAAKAWSVYLVLCRNGAIYTGIALDPIARYAQHVAGIGARYTRANPPKRLLAAFICRNQSEAARLEAAIKKLGAADKRSLVGKSGAAVRKRVIG